MKNPDKKVAEDAVEIHQDLQGEYVRRFWTHDTVCSKLQIPVLFLSPVHFLIF